MLLCLHGKRQNAEIYSQRLHRLGKRLPALQYACG